MRRREAAARWGMVGATVALTVVAAAGCDAGGFFCGSDAMCGWSETDLSRVTALANLPSTPPADASNAYATNPDAIALGKMFYFDTRFSGPSTWLDGLESHDAVRTHGDRSERGRGLRELSRRRPRRRRSGQHARRRLGRRRLDLQQRDHDVRFRILLVAPLERPHRLVVGAGCRRQRESSHHQRQPTADGVVDQRSLRRHLPTSIRRLSAADASPFDGPSSAVQAMVDTDRPVRAGGRRLSHWLRRGHDGRRAPPLGAGRDFRSRASPARWRAASRASPASRSATRGIAWPRTIRRPSRTYWSTSASRSPPTKGR